MATSHILDCTLRDGGYVNDWKWTMAETASICRGAASLAGVAAIEVGFRRTPDAADTRYGPLYYCSEETLNNYIPDDVHTPIAIMAQVGTVTIHDFCPAAQSRASIVRVLLPYHAREENPHQLDLTAFFDAVALVQGLDALGYQVMFNIGRVDKVTIEHWQTMIATLQQCPLVCLYLADTYGHVEDFVSLAHNSGLWTSTIPLGAHAHDNLGTATARTLQARRAGFAWCDGTLLGLGRGAGNARTELLADQLTRAAVQACVDSLPEGHRILLAITGALSAHVNYALICADRGYTGSEAWDALLHLVAKDRHHYFKADYLTIPADPPVAHCIFLTGN